MCAGWLDSLQTHGHSGGGGCTAGERYFFTVADCTAMVPQQRHVCREHSEPCMEVAPWYRKERSSYLFCECFAGVHLAAWGRIDTGRGSAIDMTLGIPGPSLLPLGLTDLPEDYVFMIPMHGTSTHPEIDIMRWAASCRCNARSHSAMSMRQNILSVLCCLKA